MNGWYRHPVVGFVTNFGYAYCPRHDVGQAGILGLKCGKLHRVEQVVRGDMGQAGTQCDWPGCSEVFATTRASEYVNPSLQAEFV